MAASMPGEFPSCIKLMRNLRPRNVAVRNLLAVDWSRYPDGGLRDAVSCADIVQQEVAAGMDDRITQELRNLVRATVDARSWRQSLVGWDVANRAADLGEELFACQGVGACGLAARLASRTGGLVWRISSTRRPVRSSEPSCPECRGVQGCRWARAWDIRPGRGGCECRARCAANRRRRTSSCRAGSSSRSGLPAFC